MESLVTAVGALLVRAIPTFVIVYLLYRYLIVMFFRPLEKTLAQREAETSGARKLAEDSLRRAEARAAEYEEKLRAERGQLYQEQEQLRKSVRDEQAAALASMREKAGARIKEAHLTLEHRLKTETANLDIQSDALAEQIARAVLTGSAR